MGFKKWLETWTDINQPPAIPYYELEPIPEPLQQVYELPQGIWFWLSKVYIPPEMRREGFGKTIIRQAQKKAGQGNILLRAVPIGKGIDLESLKQFYRSMGFQDFNPSQRANQNYMIWLNK